MIGIKKTVTPLMSITFYFNTAKEMKMFQDIIEELEKRELA